MKLDTLKSVAILLNGKSIESDPSTYVTPSTSKATTCGTMSNNQSRGKKKRLCQMKPGPKISFDLTLRCLLKESSYVVTAHI